MTIIKEITVGAGLKIKHPTIEFSSIDAFTSLTVSVEAEEDIEAIHNCYRAKVQELNRNHARELYKQQQTKKGE